MADILRVDKVNAVERLETYPKNPRPYIGLTERIDVLKFSMVENEEEHFEGARYLSQQRQFCSTCLQKHAVHTMVLIRFELQNTHTKLRVGNADKYCNDSPVLVPKILNKRVEKIRELIIHTLAPSPFSPGTLEVIATNSSSLYHIEYCLPNTEKNGLRSNESSGRQSRLDLAKNFGDTSCANEKVGRK